MRMIPKIRSVLLRWIIYGMVVGCLFASFFDLLRPGGSLWDSLFIAGWFGAPAGLACGLIGGAGHVLIRGRIGAWLGGVTAAAVTPGFLTWLLAGCPRLKWSVGLGPSVPWIFIPFAMIVLVGAWMAAREGRAGRPATPWRNRLCQSVPALLLASFIVIYQADVFATLSPYWLVGSPRASAMAHLVNALVLR